MSPLSRKFRYSVALGSIVLALVASPLNVFASTGKPSSSEAAWVAPSDMPEADAPQTGRWLLAGLVVVGLVILAGAAGSLAGSVAHLAGWAAAVPGAVGGIGLGATLYAGGVLVASSGFSTSSGTMTSTLSSFLNLLFGSAGSSSSGSVIDALLDQLLGSYVAGTLTTLGVLIGIGVAATQYLRRQGRSAASPFGGALGGLLGLGIAVGVVGGFSIVVSNETTSEVAVVDVTTTQLVDSVAPGSDGEQIPGITPAITVEPTATAVPPSPPTVIVLQPANCRFGPGTVYRILTHFVQGRVLPITGRSEIGSWWQVSYTGAPGACWIAGNLVEPAGDLSDVPVVAAPPPPTPTDPPDQPKLQGCYFQGVCLHHPCGPNEGSDLCWYE
jgi:hypothetical protein